MNLERHKKAFQDMYQHLVEGEVDKANVIRLFYDEYLAVNDLPAEFYLETVEKSVSALRPAAGQTQLPGPTCEPRCHPPHVTDDGRGGAR
jgi:poly(3-hydroxybutyrate) depolymerase